MEKRVQGNGNLNFINGLVFGFDVGTGSIGYAVRKGKDFLDVGVIICPEETSDLSGRRGLRSQRRTLRSKKHRRQWLREELEKLGLPAPKENLNDPVTLRVKAVNGEKLSPEELHAAIAHLWRRRGYLAHVPWSSHEEGDDRKKETGEIMESISKLREEMNAAGCALPCQFLAKHPDNQRRRVWPRELLKAEFDAIAKHQPKLADKADWLLYGDTQEVKNHHVYFKATEARNPGVLGLRWPRFDNRGPALDAWLPLDEKGRPLHVVRKNKDAFKKAQWELALMNFRVLDAQTRQKRDPRTDFPEFVAALRKQWDKTGKVTEARLKSLATPFADKFLLIPEQKPLTPDGGAGRAKYSSATLDSLREAINAGEQVDPPQPVLLRRGESPERALDRYLADIKHPLVHHRLVLLRRLLNQLIKDHGKPDLIVVEAVRSLALSQKNKNELNKRNELFRKEREDARKKLQDAGQSVSGNAIQKYRLWQEAKSRCPFCLEAISQTSLLNGEADIEHLVPRARIDCNEIYNLTIGHIQCNRNTKGNRTPYEAFCHSPKWEELKANAAECFRGKKLEIFLSPNAEELVEQKADLVQTSYIAKVLRHLCLIRLGWLGEDGRDPTTIAATPSQRFQVSNGQLTSRLRQSWGLNHVLYPEPPEGDEAARNQHAEKNRGDLRHHALDAMVISCTLPWLAHRTYGAKDEFGNFGWWTQDEKRRSRAANPIGLDYQKAKAEIKKVVVRHHVSRSNHQQAYATTLYAKKGKDKYVAREVFTTLTPENLENIYPDSLALYCNAAWTRFSEENPAMILELNETKKKNRAKYHLPASFTARLCFAHFQQWRERVKDGDNVEFDLPRTVKIPIRSVRLISVKDDTAVMPFSKGTHAYVKRTGFKEVRIHVAKDGKSLVPVFVPYWNGDQPICDRPVRPDLKPIATIRRGASVKLLRATGPKNPPGIYRVSTTMQDNIQLIPTHLAKDKEALLASGYLANGVTISWKTFLSAAGYELPHPASTQSKSAGAPEA